MLNTNNAFTTFDLVRHGEVDGAPALYGLTDIGLSQQGKQNVAATLNRLHGVTRVVSSPLRRCASTAKALAESHGVPLELVDDIQECHFGEWDGVPFDQMGQTWCEVEQFFLAPADNPPPNGECVDTLYHRVNRGWQHILDTHFSGHVVVMCHGGVIRQILASILELDWRSQKLYRQLDIRYASVTRIQLAHYDGAVPQVKFIGVTAQDL